MSYQSVQAEPEVSYIMIYGWTAVLQLAIHLFVYVRRKSCVNHSGQPADSTCICQSIYLSMYLSGPTVTEHSIIEQSRIE